MAKQNQRAPFIRPNPWSNVHVAESNPQPQITAALAAYTATGILQTVVIAPGVMPPLYETNDGTAAGTPLGELGVKIEYLDGAWTPSFVADEPAALLPLATKAAVVLRCDDGRGDWMLPDGLAASQPDNSTPSFGSLVNASGAACTPLEYCIRKGVPVTFAVITGRLSGTGRRDNKYPTNSAYAKGQLVNMYDLGCCVWRGGFELAPHSKSHSVTDLPTNNADDLWEEVCEPKDILEGISHAVSQVLTFDGTAASGHYHVTCGATTSVEIAWNATAATTRAAIETVLDAQGYTYEAANVTLRGVPLSSAFPVTIIMGDGDVKVVPTMTADGTALLTSGAAAITITVADSAPFELMQPVRGFIGQGNWPADENQMERAAETRNVLGRICERWYRWSHQFMHLTAPQLDSRLIGPARRHHLGYAEIDLSADASATIAALDTVLKPGCVYVLLVHQLGNGGDFKELIDKLAGLQEAGQIECVTASTAHSAIPCDPMLKIPGGDIATLPTLADNTWHCGYWKVNVAARFAKNVRIEPVSADTGYGVDEVVVPGEVVGDSAGDTVTLDYPPLNLLALHGTVGVTSTVFTPVPAARTLVAAGTSGLGECKVNYETGVITFHANDDPTAVTADYLANGKRRTYLTFLVNLNGIVSLYLPALRYGATHTLRFRARSTQANTGWFNMLATIQNYPSLALQVDYLATDYRVTGGAGAPENQDLRYVQAQRQSYPASGTSRLVTKKIFIPQAAGHLGCLVNISKSLTTDEFEITDVEWFLG